MPLGFEPRATGSRCFENSINEWPTNLLLVPLRIAAHASLPNLLNCIRKISEEGLSDRIQFLDIDSYKLYTMYLEHNHSQKSGYQMRSFISAKILSEFDVFEVN